ncbi:FIST signal transduction protein [Streptomyces sp. NPDC020801]|uniref:FIST signal transduction protein n=1 Tax=unclassified Streptomyces TaxID=2593676 RepID=UPI0037BDB602
MTSQARTVPRAVPAYATGTAGEAVAQLVGDLRDGLAGRRAAALLYFASSAYDPADVVPVISSHFPLTVTVGCSTAGEFTHLHNGTGGIAAVALPDGLLSNAAAALGELGKGAGEGTADAVQSLEERIQVQLRHLDPDRHLGIMLVDGLHGSEEQVNEMLGNAAPLLDFVGGSAGDDLAFERTWVAVGDKVSHHGVALMVCQSAVPFRVVKTCSFTSTGKALRITRADVPSRTVLEFNGRPATEAYAEAIGVPVEELGTGTWVGHPVGLMIDGEPWIRSPLEVVPAGGLRFYAQILPGMEVEVMRSGDLVGETATALRRARAELGGRSSGAVLFNCVLRRLETDAGNASAAFVAALGGMPSAGFHTYGESWLGHMNQTLTGVVFGSEPVLR